MDNGLGMVENPNKNRLEDSLELLSEMSSSIWFSAKEWIIMLNKEDLAIGQETISMADDLKKMSGKLALATKSEQVRLLT